MWNRSFLIQLMVAFGFGAAITWIDTRPTWDDTGITAAMILVSTATLGFVNPSRAWVFALAVASWIPAFGLLHGNHTTVMALAFGFAGAFSGAVARRLIGSMAR
ncbi:MAG TPA: hypothetical protein VFH88_14325 [Candidatus Krumholzibacteria bacterium]|nr:hypothetical protein [Candidatus Krumholzibacteria bacterium]